MIRNTIRLGAVNTRAFTSGRINQLISDPLEIENTQIIRESASKFPRPEFISFDLFGTIFKPKTSIGEQYHQIGKKFGIKKSEKELDDQFKQVYKKLLEKYPNYGKGNLSTSADWWKLLISEIFGENKELSDQLISNFSYELYPDVKETLEQLHQKGIKLVAATNSDERVKDVLEKLDIAKYFSGVYTSYEVGFSKPEREFFLSIIKGEVGERVSPEFLQNVWHVGDNYEKDFLGPVKSGINGILLDRLKESEFFINKEEKKQDNDACFMSTGQIKEENDELLVIANNRLVIGGLKQLINLFDRTEEAYSGI